MESYEESYAEAPVSQNGKSDDSTYSGMGFCDGFCDGLGQTL